MMMTRLFHPPFPPCFFSHVENVPVQQPIVLPNSWLSSSHSGLSPPPSVSFSLPPLIYLFFSSVEFRTFDFHRRTKRSSSPRRCPPPPGRRRSSLSGEKPPCLLAATSLLMKLQRTQTIEPLWVRLLFLGRPPSRSGDSPLSGTSSVPAEFSPFTLPVGEVGLW